MATKIGEFVFALGFGKPDTRNLERAQKAAAKAIADAQKAVAEGAEDAADKVEAASKAVARHGRRASKEITGWAVAMKTVGKAAREAAQEFTGAWRDPKKLTEQWSAALGRMRTGAVAIGGAALGAATGIAAIVKHTAESDAELQRWSVRLGESVSELSKLEQAAAGFAEADDVREGIQTLRENLSELAGEGTGPALESLRDLGVSLDEIAGKSAAEQLGILGDAINRVGNERGIKASLELLGGEGGKLLPFLRQGSAGMAELADEAERLGLVVGDNAAKASADLAREIGQVAAMVKAFVADISRGLMPAVRTYIGQAKEWISANRDLIKQKVAEFLGRIIPMIVELGETVLHVAESIGSFVEAVGGMENALMLAVGAFGALQVAALGLPGVMLAASAGIAIGLSQIVLEVQGVNDELDRLDARRRSLSGTSALQDIAERGELGQLTDEEFARRTKEIFEQGVAGGTTTAAARDVRNLTRLREQQLSADASRAAATERIAARRADADTKLFRQVEDRLRSRAKRRGLTVSEAGIQTALTAFKQSYRESGNTRVAAEAAGEKLDSLGKTKAAAARVNVSASEAAFGDEIRRLAAREGLDERAVRAALEAGASSLKEGAAQSVARTAALGRLGSLAGKDLTKRDNSLLSQILGQDVPDVELGTLALGATPQTLVATINNTFTFNEEFDIAGNADPRATGDAIATSLRDRFQAQLRRSTKLAKLRFIR